MRVECCHRRTSVSTAAACEGAISANATSNSSGARKLLTSEKPNAALLDYMLPDGNGVELGVQLRQIASRMQVIVMTGSVLPPEEEAICEEHDFPVLRKPFLASDVMNQIRSRLTPAAGAGAR